MDTLTLLLWLSVAGNVLVLLCLGGHLYVAYRYAPDRAKEGTIRFFRDPEGLDLFADVIGGWFKSPKGNELVNVMIEATGNAVKAKVEGMLTGAAGNAIKAATAKGTELLGAIDFGNPYLNGLWAMAPPAEKRKLIGHIRRLSGAAMAAEIEGDGETVALGGASEWGAWK